ncbi:MAG: ABC transporter permease [Acidimicrobiales bacterium]
MSAWSEFVDYVTTADHWWGNTGISQRLQEHVWLSATATATAAAAAVPVALWLGHVRRGGVAANAVVNIGRAIPSFALLALVFPFSLRYGFGLGFWPTFVALFALALPPIFTNTYSGVVGVDPAAVDAAKGMGMRGGEVLWRVEAPNALPLMLAGVRVSAVQVVATATLGAFVGFGGLGSYIYRGVAQNNDALLLTGAVLVAVLAVVTEVAFGILQRAATPWLRKGRI